MKYLDVATNVQPQSGSWRLSKDIRLERLDKRDIYHSATDPGYVAWAILWRESDGVLKLSFTEAAGNLGLWPPRYDFNSDGIQYYLKTLISTDAGVTWQDTGWQEDLDKNWQRNSDHHIRGVCQLADGTLLRNYCHTQAGRTSKCHKYLYDASKEGAGDFPYHRGGEYDLHNKSASIWTSIDGGKKWRENHVFEHEPPLFLSGVHVLRDGRVVGLGALVPDVEDESQWMPVLTESIDGGASWGEPMVIARNDDELNPQLMCEECDFVELADQSLLALYRTGGGSGFQQICLQRGADGQWQAGPPEVNHVIGPSGYPFMLRTGDGTIFCSTLTALAYSCDDGATWDTLDIGFSYYGQLAEVVTGEIICVTQTNMGDCPFPWKHDASMLQTRVNYEVIGVWQQDDSEPAPSLARLDVGEVGGFHVAMEMRVDGAGGLAYDCDGEDYRFVAMTMSAHSARAPHAAAGRPQSVFLQIGQVRDGQISVSRKVCVGQVVCGTWVELQVAREKGLLKVACNCAADPNWANTYVCYTDDPRGKGGLSLYTNRSTGAFRNVRWAKRAHSIRETWLNSRRSSRNIALDAGRE